MLASSSTSSRSISKPCGIVPRFTITKVACPGRMASASGVTAHSPSATSKPPSRGSVALAAGSPVRGRFVGRRGGGGLRRRSGGGVGCPRRRRPLRPAAAARSSVSGIGRLTGRRPSPPPWPLRVVVAVVAAAVAAAIVVIVVPLPGPDSSSPLSSAFPGPEFPAELSPAPVQRGSFACSASSQGPRRSSPGSRSSSPRSSARRLRRPVQRGSSACSASSHGPLTSTPVVGGRRRGIGRGRPRSSSSSARPGRAGCPSPPPLAASATPTLKATTSAGTSMIFMKVDIEPLLSR